jgi:Ca2+-binding RTX toxin-like protein
MRKRIFMLLTTMALGVLMVSSAALALNRIQCPNGTDASFPVTCTGTNSADSMNGTAAYDNMKGKGGYDQLYGRGDGDDLNGDYGNDTLNGAGGNDYFGDRVGTNTLNGGAGSDTFFADYASRSPYNEISKISGDDGNDYVYAADGARDTINCGPGRDWVDANNNDIVADNCEDVE